MPFPDVPRVIYQNNPLEQVICQLRFPTILRIASETPAAFQDRIRGEYPVYSSNEGPTTVPGELRTLLGSVPKEVAAVFQGITGSRTHKFETADGMRAITLEPEAIGLTDSQYHRWERFREEVARADASLREEYQPAFYSRIGLRYRDVIRRSRLGLQGREWRELLHERVLAYLAEPNAESEVIEANGRTLFQIADIPAARVNFQYGLIKRDDELCYLLDADIFVAERRNTDDALRILDEFNRVGRGVFRDAIRDKLHDALVPLPVD